MCFTAQSCLHIVINYLWLPETDQNMPYLSAYHWPVLNSAKFLENIEIPWKWANSTSWLKIPHSAKKLWSLMIVTCGNKSWKWQRCSGACYMMMMMMMMIHLSTAKQSVHIIMKHSLLMLWISVSCIFVCLVAESGINVYTTGDVSCYC